MMNGHAKTKTNGHAGPAKAAPPPSTEPAKPTPPSDPLVFVDEFPTKVRALVEAAEKTAKDAKAEAQSIGDRRYVDGMRRGAFLISMAVGGLEGPAKERVAHALEQLEDELEVATKALRAAR